MDCWLRKLQFTATFGNEEGGYTKRQCQQRTRGVADGRSEDDGHVERGENALRDFANGRTIRNRRFALWKIAENDAPDIFELAGVFEMEQNTIDLVRLHASIFENDDRVCCVEFPGRAQRGF